MFLSFVCHGLFLSDVDTGEREKMIIKIRASRHTRPRKIKNTLLRYVRTRSVCLFTQSK